MIESTLQPIEGPASFIDDAAASAHLLSWLAAPFTRPLPAGHAVQWGETRASTLRGGAIPGKSAIAP